MDSGGISKEEVGRDLSPWKRIRNEYLNLITMGFKFNFFKVCSFADFTVILLVKKCMSLRDLRLDCSYFSLISMIQNLIRHIQTVTHVLSSNFQIALLIISLHPQCLVSPITTRQKPTLPSFVP